MSDPQLKLLGGSAALLAMLSVLIGAFAAHGLKSIVDASAIETIKTAVHYQFMHSVSVLVILAFSMSTQFATLQRWLKAAVIAMLLGCLLFSGSLYALALTKMAFFGPITPLGGIAFVIGWACLIYAFMQLGNKNECP